MKISRITALRLLIPLSAAATLAVYLNAQEAAAPVPRGPVIESSGAGAYGPTENRANARSAIRLQYHGSAPDPKTLQLFSDEQAADQEARGLAASYSEAGNDELRGNIKKKLRDKLAAIFEMQQKRRTAEIAAIEERLAKLKDVSKKRETNKDPIVDRRLEQLTGGVDELGWEESNRGATRYPVGEHGPYFVEPRLNGPNIPNSFAPPVPSPNNNVPAIEPGNGLVPELPRSSK